jgi:hypothetical protein
MLMYLMLVVYLGLLLVHCNQGVGVGLVSRRQVARME